MIIELQEVHRSYGGFLSRFLIFLSNKMIIVCKEWLVSQICNNLYRNHDYHTIRNSSQSSLGSCSVWNRKFLSRDMNHYLKRNYHGGCGFPTHARFCWFRWRLHESRSGGNFWTVVDIKETTAKLWRACLQLFCGRFGFSCRACEQMLFCFGGMVRNMEIANC